MQRWKGMQHITSATQQGSSLSIPTHCAKCGGDREAYEAMIASYERRIAEKRQELARLSNGQELARYGHTRLAIVQLLREMSPHVMPMEVLQIHLLGDESEPNRKNLIAQVQKIRKNRFGLVEGEEIVTVPGAGYKLVKSSNSH